MLKNEIDLEELKFITDIARLYYLEGSTQAEIADALGLSRSKVSRLLRKAGEEGIIKVTIQPPAPLIVEMEKELIARFGLKQVFICSDHLNPDIQRANVAAQIADYLSRNLKDGMVVSVGLGRNTSAVADQISDLIRFKLDCTFVPAMGGAPLNETYNPDFTCRRMAERFGGRSESLYAPAYVETPSVRNSLFSHETVRRSLDIARRSTFALIGIGDTSDEATAVRMGCFPVQDMLALRQAGAVGDISGYFYDIHGAAITTIQDRVIGLSIDDLRRIPNVIAVVSERNKSSAMLGALRTGVIDILATSSSNVQAVLALEAEMRSEP